MFAIGLYEEERLVQRNCIVIMFNTSRICPSKLPLMFSVVPIPADVISLLSSGNASNLHANLERVSYITLHVDWSMITCELPSSCFCFWCPFLTVNTSFMAMAINSFI